MVRSLKLSHDDRMYASNATRERDKFISRFS